LIESTKQKGSAEETLSNQSIGWCCIDSLNRQRLPYKWNFGQKHMSGNPTTQASGPKRSQLPTMAFWLEITSG